MQTFLDQLKKAWNCLPRSEKKYIYILLALMGILAILETMGVSLILSFIQVVNDMDSVRTSKIFSKIYAFSGLTDPKQFCVELGFVLVSVFVFKNFFFMMANHFEHWFLARNRTYLAVSSLTHLMRQPYTLFLRSNTIDLSVLVSASAKVIDQVYLPALWIISESMVFLVMLGFLIKVRPFETMTALGSIGVLVYLFYFIFKKKTSKWSLEQHDFMAVAGKWQLQMLSGNKEIRITGRDGFFLNQYEQAMHGASAVGKKLLALNQLPRVFLETIVVSALIGLVIWTLEFKTAAEFKLIIPTLTLFAAAAVRLMPSMGRILSSALLIRQGIVFLDRVYDVQTAFAKEQKHDKVVKQTAKPMALRESIDLDKVSYFYPAAEDRPAVREISLKIKRGESVAFVGPSGAGKTTLVDLILGILSPVSGEIRVDGISIGSNLPSWQGSIGYVPQHIFLTDDSIRANIAFGYETNDIDEKLVWNALEKAHLADFVRTLPEGINTFVGERGVRLSGGQRQRIGIARALYAKPAVLLLDEATSALDSETEVSIAQSIEKLAGETTVIIIAHRLSTVAKCDRIFFLEAGRLVDTDNFQALLSRNRRFAEFASGGLAGGA